MAWVIWQENIGTSDLMEILLPLGVLKEKQATERSCDLKCAMREMANVDLPVSQHENGIESVVAYSTP
jgi:hypothetical protein